MPLGPTHSLVRGSIPPYPHPHQSCLNTSSGQSINEMEAYTPHRDIVRVAAVSMPYWFRRPPRVRPSDWEIGILLDVLLTRCYGVSSATTGCAGVVAGKHSKFDPQLLSQCCSTYNASEQIRPAIHLISDCYLKILVTLKGFSCCCFRFM